MDTLLILFFFFLPFVLIWVVIRQRKKLKKLNTEFEKYVSDHENHILECEEIEKKFNTFEILELDIADLEERIEERKKFLKTIEKE
jgi:ethanolamine utilization cobalamin adenosyltransferase